MMEIREVFRGGDNIQMWHSSLNSGLCACKAVALPLEPYLQFILLWLFWRWESHELFARAGLEPRSFQSQLPK
jgi:hypothetical protein